MERKTIIESQPCQRLLKSALALLEERVGSCLEAVLRLSRHGGETGLYELGYSKTLLLLFIKALADRDSFLCSLLGQLANGFGPLESPLLADCLRQEYSIGKDLIEAAFKQALLLNRSQVIRVPESVIGILRKLSQSHEVDITANLMGNATASKQNASELKSTPICESTLHNAVSEGDVRTVTRLINEGTDIYSLDCKGRTAMHLAVMSDSKEMVRVLAGNKFDVKRRFAKTKTVLFYTAYPGRQKALEKLDDVVALTRVLKWDSSVPIYDNVRECNIPQLNSQWETYLHFAASRNCGEALEALLENETPVDDVNSEDETAMTIAVKKNAENATEALLRNKADINRVTKERDTYVHIAAAYNSSDVLRKLLEYGAPLDPINANDETPLAIAVKMNNTNVIHILSEFGADLMRKFHGGSYLHLAVDSCNVGSLRALLKKGVPPDYNPSDKMSPIGLAISRDDTTAAAVLAEFGAVLGGTDNNLLHVAAAAGKIDSIKWLIQNGLSVNSVDNDLQTPLHFAAYFGQLEAATTLVELNSHVDSKTRDGLTPYHLARDRGNKAVASYIMKVNK